MRSKTIWPNVPLKDIKNYANNILRLYPEGSEINNMKYKKDLKEIFDNHPWKCIPDGPFKIVVGRHDRFRQKCFYIISAAGKRYSFSFKNAKKNNLISLRKVLSDVCRYLVKDQVYYKKEQIILKNGSKCQKTNVYYPKSELHLHHEPPYEFNVVCDSFIKMKDLELSNEMFQESSNGELEFSNAALKYEFLKYHAKVLNHGHVSLVHKDVNIRLGSSYSFKNDNHPYLIRPIQLSLFDGGSDVF